MFSPSAEVRGHGPGQEVLQTGKSSVCVERIEPVGHYAVQIAFDDGHDSGLYSWRYLRDLAERQDHYWQQYLQQLSAAGKSRDPKCRSCTSTPKASAPPPEHNPCAQVHLPTRREKPGAKTERDT